MGEKVGMLKFGIYHLEIIQVTALKPPVNLSEASPQLWIKGRGKSVFGQKLVTIAVDAK